MGDPGAVGSGAALAPSSGPLPTAAHSTDRIHVRGLFWRPYRAGFLLARGSGTLAAVVLFASTIAATVPAGALDSQAVNAAFIEGLGLWSALMPVDELLQQYDGEHAHVLFFMAQLLTLIALHQLPA